MRNNIAKVCWWLSVALICGTIFMFSSQDAKVSTDSSISVIQTVIKPGTEKADIPKTLDRTVRKWAHFIIYGALGFCAMGSARSTFKKAPFLIVLLCCCVYAGTDEIHQLFVEGRAGKFTDVILDTIGSCFGICCYLTACKIRQKFIKS